MATIATANPPIPTIINATADGIFSCRISSSIMCTRIHANTIKAIEHVSNVILTPTIFAPRYSVGITSDVCEDSSMFVAFVFVFQKLSRSSLISGTPIKSKMAL